MKKTIRLLSFSVVAVLLVVTILSCVSCTAVESPKVLFQKAVSRTVNSYEKIEAADVAKKVVSGGSFEIKAEDLKLDDETKAEGSALFYANSSKKTGAVVLNAKIGDETYDAAVYASTKSVVAQSAKLFGSNVYGVNIQKAVENFKKSVFYFESDSDNALPESASEEILNALQQLKDTDAIEKDGKKLYDKYLKKLYKLCGDNAEFTKENTDADVLGESVSSTLLTVKLTNESISKIVSDFWKDAKSDKALKSFISDRLIPLLADKYEDVGDLYDDIDSEVEDIVEDLEDADITITLKYYLNKSSGAIMKASLTVKQGNNKATYGVELGRTFKKFEGFRVTIKSGNSDTESIWVKVTSDTKEELKISVIATDSFKIPEITLKYTKADGNIKITIPGGYDGDTVIKLTYTKSGSTHTFLLNSITVDDEKFELPFGGKYSVIVNTKAKAPSAPSKYTDILTMTDEKFDEFMDEIQENVNDIVSDFGGGSEIVDYYE